jgi:hypothetical protein
MIVLFWYTRYHGKASNNLWNAFTVEHGIISTYEQTGMLKINNSYEKNCESSCCLLAAFLPASWCICLNC